MAAMLLAATTLTSATALESATVDEAPALEQPLAATYPWTNLIAEIPPLPPAPDAEQFGARLGRTMALLETSTLTRRPVRIIFYGQSITKGVWTQLLVQRLRERYPHAIIESENVALGGWSMPSLMRTLGHNVLRNRPDLVVFHVYGGSLDQWDRVIATIRRETCAEILMRSPHPQVYSSPTHEQKLDANTLEIRAVAQKFDGEFVECRREWGNYLQVHGIAVSNLLSDDIHPNRKGNVLMAQLYERHFRVNMAARCSWADRVRWYGAGRPLEDHRDDEITLHGEWRNGSRRWVEARATNASLRLPFIGNRVDVMLAPGSGSARVLIDGRPPSAQNLYHGTFPLQDPYGRRTPVLQRYFTGTNMVAEAWTLKVTEWTGDCKQFRYRVFGSVTGPDGEGESGQDFVSRSGRIRIYANDLKPRTAPPAAEQGIDPKVMRPAPDDLNLTWNIVSDSCDVIRGTPAPPDSSRDNPPYTWITIADGLPCGQHELTLIPAGNGPIGIVGVEIGRPPLWGIQGCP